LKVQKRIKSVKSGISKASGAQADVLYAPGDTISFGSQTLQVLPTPGER
jgi:glyoxylase-like metal-dependent hydrolase (beta-lactamase superfamily II)